MKKVATVLILVTVVTLVGAPPALAQEPPECELIYVVQAGDWLSSIAEEYLDDPLAYEAILTAGNALADDIFTDIDSPDLVEPGMVLCIPADLAAPAGLSPEALANAEYKSEWTQSGTATLVEGEFREPAAPGSATETVVSLTDQIAYGQLNGQPAAAVVLVTDPGGSGTFFDLVVMVSQNGQPVNMATTNLGDRLIIHNVSIIDNEIVVDMVQAGPDDPLCCPTQWVVNRYALQGDQLVQSSSETVETITSRGGLTPEPVTFDPNGLASAIEGIIVPALPYDDSIPSEPIGHPDQVLFLFDDEERLTIYPIAEYQAIWDTAGNSQVTDQVNLLRSLLAARAEAPAAPLPSLPPTSTANDLAAQVDYLDFANGSGVRYVGRTAQGQAPIANDQLNYYFQGLTADGNYYVSFIFPVATPALPDTIDDVPAEMRQQAETDFEAYLQQTTETLDGLSNADTDWLPPLSMLDAMVQSLTINP